MHNGATSTKTSYTSYIEPSNRRQPQQQPKSLSSIFTANPIKPALGRIFDQFAELHILMSPMPKRREDAELLYGQDDSPFRSGTVEHCTVVEVLKDETPDLGTGRLGGFGKRERRWAAVQEASDGLSLVASFQDKGTIKGIGDVEGTGA
jgi:hypothetical protein